MSIEHIFTDKVRAMQAYHVPNSGSIIKLDAMESPYKLPEEMRQSLGAMLALVNINRYPNPKSSSLVAKIKQVFSIADEFSVMLGNGSDELIQIILMATMRPGASVLSVAPSFVMYQQTAELLGMKYVGVDVRSDFSLDEELFLATLEKEQPAVTFLAYPNNPTGMALPLSFIREVCARAQGLVVIDEAYTAYAEHSAESLLTECDNVVVIRTLSKIGLAGIRLGYMIGSPMLVEQFNKVRMPYNINLLTQATARFALDQRVHFDACVQRIMEQKQSLYEWLVEQHDVEVFASETNFLLVRCKDANTVFSQLRDEHGILVKSLHGAHPVLDNVLRITIGDEKENKALKDALTTIFANTVS